MNDIGRGLFVLYDTRSLMVLVTALCCIGVFWAARGIKIRSRNPSDSPISHLKTLRSFEYKEVLKDEDDGRVVTLLGRFHWQNKDEMALVKITATPLSLDGLLNNLGRLVLDLKSYSGAEYAFYDCALSPWKTLLRGLQACAYSLEIVAPASQKTVDRNRSVPMAMCIETPEMYASITKPHVERLLANGKSLSWISNVLSKKSEAERVLYEDEDKEHGFLMNVDTKWRTHPNMHTVPRDQWRNHPCVTDLYCLAICHKRGIRTLRDLRATHLPMLHEMYTQGVKTINDIYGVPEDQLRVFVHYIPQFYHFHVHFARLNNTIGVEAERAHLLVDIMQNLAMDSNFYVNRSIQFKLRENNALYQELKDGES